MDYGQLKAITIEDQEEYLRKKSSTVDLEYDNILDDHIKILAEYCKKNEVMAMAAIQLGIPKRIIYLKNTNIDIINKKQINATTQEENEYNEERILINPVVLEKIGLTEYWEACASCLDYVGLVKRPYKIVVEFFDQEHNKHRDIFEGFSATVLSHELDHLDGILHIDIADEIRILPKNERRQLRQIEGYHILNKEDSYESLLEKKKKGK